MGTDLHPPPREVAREGGAGPHGACCKKKERKGKQLRGVGMSLQAEMTRATLQPDSSPPAPGLWRQADRGVSPGKAPGTPLAPPLGIYNTKRKKTTVRQQGPRSGAGHLLLCADCPALGWGGGEGGKLSPTGYHKIPQIRNFHGLVSTPSFREAHPGDSVPPTPGHPSQSRSERQKGDQLPRVKHGAGRPVRFLPGGGVFSTALGEKEGLLLRGHLP